MFTPFLSSAIFRAFYISLFIFSVPLFSQWANQNSGTPTDLYIVRTIDANTVIASGRGIPPDIHGEILRTTNGGAIWTSVLNDTTFRPLDIQFVNSQTGYAVGGLYSQQYKVYKTTDAGSTWQMIFFPVATNYPSMSSAQFINEQTGIACGYSGTISLTTNGGSNWVQVFNWPNAWTTTKLNCIYMADNQNGWCVGDSGKAIKTTNGGLNWLVQPQFTTAVLRSVYFTDVNNGYAAGESAVVFKTTNAGATWSNVPSGSSQILKSVCFTNSNTGYICGGTGLILKTTTAGNSWFTLNSFVTDTLNSIRFSGTDTGYAVGNNGRIIKTTTGGVIGITQISSGVPKEFSLNQNYPNPFNPSTEFEFNIAKAGPVKITVFDILGNNIEVLVNGELKPGTYKAQWNASRFASGVYLYRIETSGFTLTKKMTLLK